MENNIHKYNRIESLQVLRGLAFLAIFSAHARLTRLGPFGVSVFFVLSGFVAIYSSVGIRYTERITIRYAVHFMSKRLKKLFPLHLMMIGCTLPFLIETSDSFWKKLRIFLSNSFLVQSWFSRPDYYFTLNSVSWFLSVCAFLYFCFPFIDAFFKKQQRLSMNGIAIIGIVVIIVGGFFYYLAWKVLPFMFPDRYMDLINYITYICPLTRLLDFICGCLLGKIYLFGFQNKKNHEYRNLYTLIELGIICLLYLIQAYRGNTLCWWTESIVYLPISLATVYLFAINRGFITIVCSSLKSLKQLGDLSGKTFLIHWVVIKYVEKNCYGGLFVTAFVSLIITIMLAVVYNVISRYIVARVEFSRKK